MEFYRVETIHIYGDSELEINEAISRIGECQDIVGVRRKGVDLEPILSILEVKGVVVEITRRLELLPDTLKAPQGS